VEFDVLPVGGDRRALEAGRVAALEPQLGGLGDGDALAVGGVGPGADGDADDGMVRVGIALLREGLDVAVTGLIDVVDDPCLPDLPVGALSGALAN
jgi:hypothetical protein